jgi:hypothetical protein
MDSTFHATLHFRCNALRSVSNVEQHEISGTPVTRLSADADSSIQCSVEFGSNRTDVSDVPLARDVVHIT